MLGAKVIARAGLCSRRDAERLIGEGRVKLNGKVLTAAATNVTAKDTVLVDNLPLPQKEETRLWRYHKPAGLVVSNRDPEGRRILDTAAELIHAPEPLSFVAASDADYAAYRTFYQAAPAELR